jgi:SPP1 family predicted phage head-tail adaptor
MRAGNLRHRVTIEKRQPGYDEAGQPVESWEPFVTTWADVIPVRGREVISATLAATLTDVKFVMRYVEGIEAGMRVVFRGIAYTIKAALNEGTRDRMLTLVTTSTE